MIDFYRKNGLPNSLGKLEPTDRVAYFLDMDKILSFQTVRKKVSVISSIKKDTEIEANFVCFKRHRAFFKKHIVVSFSFDISFLKSLKSNLGKTYKDAISAYYQILADKKKGTS